MANTFRRRRVFNLGLLLQVVLLVVGQLADHLAAFIPRMTSATSALRLVIVRTIVQTHRLQAASDRWI